MTKNLDIATLFRNMGTLLEIRGENAFKIKAYDKAADIIQSLPEDIERLYAEGRLADLPGIGKTLRDKIEEYLSTGQLDAYQRLIAEIPESMLELAQIPSLGPKKLKLFYDRLGITSLEDLTVALDEGKLVGLPGIQQRTLDKVRQGLEVVRQGLRRMNLSVAQRLAGDLGALLKERPEVRRVEYSGSLRRGRETIGDIDILIASDDPAATMDFFINLPMVRSTNAHGPAKSSVVIDKGRQVDLRIVDPSCWGAAQLYFTGSKNFNIKLRQLAQQQQKKVSEYGIFRMDGDSEDFLVGETEEACLRELGLPMIAPELREDIDERRLFSGDPLPKLIEVKDIRGELHVHSTWSDGRHSIAEMVDAAQQQGYSYLAISDHSYKLRVAGGVAPEDLKRKRAEIDELNKQLKGFRVLMGSEVEIDLEGNLDYNEDILAGLDVVVAAVHSGFDMSEEKMTERLLKAVRHPQVNILAHPTGRHLGKRESYRFDMDRVCRAAVENHVALEINASPVRLDLNDRNIYFARTRGVRFAVNTDAHHMDQFHNLNFGILMARRGWLTKQDVINTRSLEQLLDFLGKKTY